MVEELRQAINYFAKTFGREGHDFGRIELGQKPFEGSNGLPVNGQVEEFYRNTIFDKLVINGALRVRIQPPDKLEKAQEGWRWTIGSSGKLAENPSWPKEYLVIGDLNEDAIFVNTTDEKSSVFGRIHGGGTTYQLSNSFASFLNILSDCMIMEQIQYDYEIEDDDFVIKPEFIEDVRQIVLRHERDIIADNFINFFFS